MVAHRRRSRRVCGATDTANLAALCRHHHRLKTHAGWQYAVLEPGVYLWSEPHGQQFVRTRDGTRDVTGAAAAKVTAMRILLIIIAVVAVIYVARLVLSKR